MLFRNLSISVNAGLKHSDGSGCQSRERLQIQECALLRRGISKPTWLSASYTSFSGRAHAVMISTIDCYDTLLSATFRRIPFPESWVPSHRRVCYVLSGFTATRRVTVSEVS